MKAKKRTRKLQSVVSIRLSEGQAEQLVERARQNGQSSSDWGRQAILQCLEVPPGTRVVLEELMALRKVFLALKLDEIRTEKLTDDRLRFLIEQAETTKHAMAGSRIDSMRKNSSHE